MADILPGWYDDTDDPALARWWDGRGWTEHTLVIAEQPPGVEPPPPVTTPTRFPVPPPPHEWLDDPAYAEDPEHDFDPVEPVQPVQPVEPVEPRRAEMTVPVETPPLAAWPPIRDITDGGWHRLEDDDDDLGHRTHRRHRHDPDDDRRRWIGGGAGTLGDRVRDLPPRLRVAIPIVLLVLLVGAVASAAALRSDGDGDDGGTDQTVTRDTQLDPQRLRVAADLALGAADISWFTQQGFLASIPLTCGAMDDDDPQRVVDRILLLGYDDYTAGRLVTGLEVGTGSYCPDELEDHPGFFDEVYELSGASAVAPSSTTVVPDITTTTATTKVSPPTTVKRSSPPATTPPTQAPTTTAAPTTTTTLPATTTTVEAPTTTAP